MAQNPRKPAGKRRPTPKVAGHTRPVRPESDEVTTDTGVTPSTSDEATNDAGVSMSKSGEVTTDAEAPATPDLTESVSSKPDLTKPDLTKPKTRPVSRVSTLRPSSTDPTAADAAADTLADAPRGRRGSGVGEKVRSTPLAAILAAVAVVLGIAALVLAFHPGASIGPNKAFIEREATSELTGQAQQRICAVFGYEHTELDDWQKRAQDALTGQAREEFDKTFKAQKDLITQTKTGAECRVDALGVKDLAGDRATVIANLIISETQNSMATNSGAPRAQFAMVREGDTWRIQGVEPF
ncbi:hypothetical protein C5O27_21930 [Gordonia alkanivorans]|uniref:hypothetical protein n=1 Tax=Gordonia alkanivorans TaxID=84096 RepID=UPI000FDE0F7B|nr:hypothetical protein [Gordonia alkanivorans]AZZ83377.1 hypothetical protein C5O27_21930 [Gordonia alkanivorans]